MYFMKFAQQCIIGASPELLFRLRQGEMETYPLAGTAKRGIDVIEDRQLARALLNDAKEIAEHNMLVDLHRNDIGRVAQFGTVKVRSLMDIKRFSHVQHISLKSSEFCILMKICLAPLPATSPLGRCQAHRKLKRLKLLMS